MNKSSRVGNLFTFWRRVDWSSLFKRWAAAFWWLLIRILVYLAITTPSVWLGVLQFGWDGYARYVTTATIWSGLIIQSLYIATFATRAWRDDPFTRSMMLKSTTIWMLFALAAVRFVAHGGPSASSTEGGWQLDLFAIEFDYLIVWAMLYQLITLLGAMRKGRQYDGKRKAEI